MSLTVLHIKSSLLAWWVVPLRPNVARIGSKVKGQSENTGERIKLRH